MIYIIKQKYTHQILYRNQSFTCRQVLPCIFKFLVESSTESIDKNSVNIYKFTQVYKLQHELLSTLGTIARLLKLRERELWQILSNTESYLSARQNPMLQVILSQKEI